MGQLIHQLLLLPLLLYFDLQLRYPQSALVLLLFMYLANDSKRTTKLILMKLFPHGRRSFLFCH